MSAPHTIVLISRSYLYREGRLGDDTLPITPGMAVEITGGGDNPTLEPCGTATANLVPLIVAVEMPEVLGRGIDDPYTVELETVLYYNALSGDHLYMLLAATENVAANDALEVSDDGTLVAAIANAQFRALEAVNNSAGTTAARIRVEVL